ncbi:protein-lysine N-methyltransferase EEF2KMT [Trichogramma pretiosum]|uniref:protein-lysine N-methyltransferase EEF2KMT n=1 Tax=Trichogramma pretiosum TaxID=7493 RepID=UPI0006C96B70|nr:protein-lysine N-methyltransferase EEF2KMT [Trichogramma pretiosum]
MLDSNSNNIILLKKQFLCCTPLSKFKWPDISFLKDVEIQKEIIQQTVTDENVLKYPMKQSYVKAFLKFLIDMLENIGADVDESIYDAYCEIISKTTGENSMHYRHFFIKDETVSHTLIIKESHNIISQGTTGLCSWKAAFHLAEWCIANKNFLKGKSILELGSGVGLSGLTALKFCEPSQYYFSDCHPVVLKTLEENIRLNLLMKHEKPIWIESTINDQIQFSRNNAGQVSNVSILNLLWEDIDESKVIQLKADIVIAADILYDSSSFESLVISLKRLLEKTANLAVIAVTIRNEMTLEHFLHLIDQYGLKIELENTETPPVFVQTEVVPTKIYKITV